MPSPRPCARCNLYSNVFWDIIDLKNVLNCTTWGRCSSPFRMEHNERDYLNSKIWKNIQANRSAWDVHHTFVQRCNLTSVSMQTPYRFTTQGNSIVRVYHCICLFISDKSLTLSSLRQKVMLVCKVTTKSSNSSELKYSSVIMALDWSEARHQRRKTSNVCVVFLQSSAINASLTVVCLFKLVTYI